jgi:DUF2934 family protein
MSHMAKRLSSSKADDAPSSRTRSARRPQAPPDFPEAPNEGGQIKQAPGDAVAMRTKSESMASEPSEEDIRLRAYQVYLGRGGDDGSDFDDWLQAEKELRRKE